MIRSILSVFAGFAAMVLGVAIATAVAVKLMLHPVDMRSAMSLKPTPMYLAVNLVYSSGFAALGGFVTASLAVRSPMSHVLALAILMLMMSVVSFVQNMSSQQPRWYGFTLIVLGPMSALIGGYLQTLRQTH